MLQFINFLFAVIHIVYPNDTQKDIENDDNWIDDMDLSNIQTIIDAWTHSLQSSEYIQNGFKAMSSGEEGSKKK